MEIRLCENVSCQSFSCLNLVNLMPVCATHFYSYMCMLCQHTVSLLLATQELHKATHYHPYMMWVVVIM